MPRTSPRKRAQPAAAPADPDVKPQRAVSEVKAGAKATAGAKRKVKVEPEEEAEQAACDSCGEGKEEADEKPAKKRKTTGKAAKTEDMAPLATRTVVSSLKRAMYIGAHVSGAGGEFAPSMLMVPFCRLT